ncbi:hypothetical protein [Mycobacterium sp. DL592]|uniref:hypothetical protein n=1 Tax=Mycobacterium sp. DL592 TaxID=2675524 RepID=UPI0014212832|nr:hypothetical protein [Mycobacterium sp. DL592]
MGQGQGNSGCFSGAGGFVFVLIILIATVPKEVWIGLGATVAAVALIVVTVKAAAAHDKNRAAAEEQARVEKAAREAAAKREREEKARKVRQHRIDTLGAQNAQLVESTLGAVKQITASEAAREGWLGDVDFTADITRITNGFEKAYALRKVANELSALDNPGADDRTLLAEAQATVTDLECAALERVGLIAKCANEAQLVDQSLRAERRDARTAEQRAQLHAELSAMLYGIEATPNVAPTNSAAESVMARVAAYREIKNQIQRTRQHGDQ